VLTISNLQGYFHFCHLADILRQTPDILLPSETNERGNPLKQNKMNIDTIANQIQGTQFQKDLTTEMLINGKRSTRAYYNEMLVYSRTE
jgi:hypothetical protein